MNDNREPRNTSLDVNIENGILSISIGVDALVEAVQANPHSNFFGLVESMKVTDNDAFAEAILFSLQEEREDGATPVHIMFDRAAEHAIEQGCDGVEEVESNED